MDECKPLLRGLQFGDGEPEDYHVWRQFPFDAPDLNLRIEMTSLTVKNFKAFKAGTLPLTARVRIPSSPQHDAV